MQVRTPLNGCLASAEMLLETSLGAEQRELARTIRVSGSILLSTVSNFLDFFKLEAGKPLDVVRREINVQVRSQCRSLAIAERKAGQIRLSRGIIASLWLRSPCLDPMSDSWKVSCILCAMSCDHTGAHKREEIHVSAQG